MEAFQPPPFRGFKDFYQHVSPTRVIVGRDLLGSTGFEFLKEGAHRVFVVTDQVIRATGLVERVEAGIADGGIEVAGVFDEVPQDSSIEVVDRCAAAAKEAGADSFLAVGGGSVMDTAKVADAVFTHGGTAREQEGFFLMPRADDGMGRPLEIAPLACIPTTAGTGSEVSLAAVIKDPEQKIKVEIGDFPLFPRLAILDPETTRTLPPQVAAATGMDAMTHAIEGYTCVDWSPHQDARSLRALRLMRDNLERAVERGEEDEEARGSMLVAASLAITLNLGAVHALSHPVGAHHGVPHGVANAIHLPHVIRFNAAAGGHLADRFRDVNEVLGLETGGSDEDVAETLAAHVTDLVERLGLPTRLSQTGVPEESIPALVEGAMGDAASLLNPREVGEDDYAGLYRRAL
ncbi:MAG TPA: iron-containing alcohol dehydrogenase [Thermoleophilaceae bacterium]|nr:iron-containing alcohol dehydrogenase [Thermoleophilaceae bacterium]